MFCKVVVRVSDGLGEDRITPVLAPMSWAPVSQPGGLHMAGAQQIFTDWEDELVKTTGGCKEVSGYSKL